MNQRRFLVGSIALTACLLVAGGRSEAQVPQLIRYQSQVADAQGAPLAGPQNLTFRLYDAQTGGQKVWEETQAATPLTGGRFDVLLGSVTSLGAVDWTKPLWLAVRVGTQAELTPRQQITLERLTDPVQNTALNLLKDGSFEVWDAPVNRLMQNWYTSATVAAWSIVKQESQTVKFGNIAVKLVRDGRGHSGNVNQEVADLASLRGQPVTSGAWLYARDPETLCMVTWDADGFNGDMMACHPGGNVWQYVAITRVLDPRTTRLTVTIGQRARTNELPDDPDPAYADGAVLVAGPTPFVLSSTDVLQPPSPIQFRGTICTGCTAEMSLAGHPDNSQRLVHVSRDRLSLSTDGGKTWQSKPILELTNGAYDDGAINANLIALDDGSFVIASQASFTAKANKLGGILYQGGWTGPLGSSIVQDIPANDTHNEFFPFLNFPKIAAQPSGTLFILGDAWFEATKTRAPALYLWDQNTKTATRQRLEIPEAPILDNAVLAGIEAAVLTREGQLYAVVVYPTEAKVGALIKGELLRFRTVNPAAFDRFPLPGGNAHLVAPRLTSQSTHAWLVDQGPKLLVDESPTSPHRGRLYVVWAQEEQVVTDPAFEAGTLLLQGAYGVNYHLYAISSTDRGATWSSPRRIDQGTGAVDHAYPSAALDKNGTLHVAFIGLREPALADVFYASSTDGGVNFSKSLKISEQPLSILDPAQKDDNGALGESLHMVAASTDGVSIAYPCNKGADACFARLAGVPSTQLPTLSGLSNRTVLVNNTVSFDVTAADPDTAAANLVFSYSPLLSGASFVPTANPAVWRFTWSPSSSQTVALTFKVTDDPSDASGQRTASQTITITASSPQPPAPTLPQVRLTKPAGPFPVTVAPGEKVALEALVTSGTATSVAFYQGGTFLENGISTPTNAWVATWTAPQLEGTYSFTAHGYLGIQPGNDSTPVSVRVQRPNALPVWNDAITWIAPTNGQPVAGEPLGFTVQATDADSPSLTYGTRLGLPAGAAFDPATRMFTWQNPTAGRFPVLFVVTDESPASTDTTTWTRGALKSVSIEVAAKPEPPQAPQVRLTQPSQSLTVIPGESVQLQAEVVSGRVTNMDFLVDGVRIGSDVDGQAPYLFTWTAPATEKAYVISARGTNEVGAALATGTASASVTVTVQKPPMPLPVVRIVTPAQDTTFELGRTIHVEAQVVSGAVKTMEYFLNGRLLGSFPEEPPSGSNVFRTNLFPLWAEGTHTLTVRGINPEGKAGPFSDPIGITVKKSALPVWEEAIQWGFPANGQPLEGEAIVFVVQANDADTPPNQLTYGQLLLPAGATFNPASHLFRWDHPTVGWQQVVLVVTDEPSPASDPQLWTRKQLKAISFEVKRKPNIAQGFSLTLTADTLRLPNPPTGQPVTVTATWNVNPSTLVTNNDFIAVVPVGPRAPGFNLLYQFTAGARSGTATFTLPAAAATYEVQYHRMGTPSDIPAKASVTVQNG